MKTERNTPQEEAGIVKTEAQRPEDGGCHKSASQRLRQRVDKIVGGHGFVTISVSDARAILSQCDGGALLDQIDAVGGKITVTLPEARGEA